MTSLKTIQQGKNFDIRISDFPVSDKWIRYDHFDNCSHARRFQPTGYILWQTGIEVLVPAYDHGFIDIALTIPPELRYNYRIYRKFLKKLTPELIKPAP